MLFALASGRENWRARQPQSARFNEIYFPPRRECKDHALWHPKTRTPRTQKPLANRPVGRLSGLQAAWGRGLHPPGGEETDADPAERDPRPSGTPQVHTVTTVSRDTVGRGLEPSFGQRRPPRRQRHPHSATGAASRSKSTERAPPKAGKPEMEHPDGCPLTTNTTSADVPAPPQTAPTPPTVPRHRKGSPPEAQPVRGRRGGGCPE